MTQPIAFLDGPWWPYLAVLLFAALPTEIWRWGGVIFARRLDEGSRALELVRLIAVALMAGVVAKLVLTPSGALAGLPLWLRLAALATGLAVLGLNRRHVLPAVLVGETMLICGGFWLQP